MYSWTNGELITAEKLNNTGSGVLIVNNNNDVLDKTFKEILDAYVSGQTVLIKVAVSENSESYEPVLTIFHYTSGDGGQISSADGQFTANNDDDYPSSDGGK